MAISNYSELRTALANFGNRDDLDSNLDNFIVLAESRMVRDLKDAWQLHVTTTMTVDAQSETLPTDFSSLVRATIDSEYPTLEYTPPNVFHSIYAVQTSGRPVTFTIEGTSILFAPTPTDTYTMTYTYVAKPDIATDTTNNLLTMYPDVYLFACLMELADFIHDDKMLAKYTARYAQAAESVEGVTQYIGDLSQKSDVP